MSKRAASSQASGVPKRQKKVMTLQEKVELLDMLKTGKTYAAVARAYHVNESTVRYIKKKEDEIRKTVAATFHSAAKTTATVRDKGIVKMEKALAIWIKDRRKNYIPLDGAVIMTKAKTLYDMFAPEGEEGQQGSDFEEAGPSTSSSSSSSSKGFTASRGWFYRFMQRYQLKSVVLHGETASADIEAARTYPETLREIIREGNYHPEQVFNMDETGLFWKKMPSRTYLMKEEARAPGYKAQKDRVTLLMCGNAAGFMLKPGLIHRAANPRALKNKSRHALPVFWMHNKKAWVTKALTSKWFFECFVPQVKDYLRDQCMEFKALLLMDNAGGHPIDLQHDRVRVEFLPPNTTSLIQPMDQGVIRAFKALYTRNALQYLVGEMDVREDFSLKEYWKGFTIAKCLTIIKDALGDMKKETLNSSWKKLWPECVHDYKGFSPNEVQTSAIKRAVILARHLGGEGFDDITQDEIGSLIDEHSQTLTDEDLEELAKSASEEEEIQEEAGAVAEEDDGLSIERLAELIRLLKELKEKAFAWDPFMERAMKVQNSLEASMNPYISLYSSLRKQAQQLPITCFFKPVTQPCEQTPEDPPEDPLALEDPLAVEEAPADDQPPPTDVEGPPSAPDDPPEGEDVALED